MDQQELKYWIAFSRVPHVGRVRFGLLESRFGSLAEAWRAGEAELRRAGLDERTVSAIVAHRRSADNDPDGEMERLDRNGVCAVTMWDKDYPPRLKEIEDLPPVLYYQGTLTSADERSVALVGTRKATAYGREIAHRISLELAQAGVTVVSGLAAGVDGIAHKAALEAGKRTIAVVASGLDTVYPREHANLARQIAESGAVVSEHPVGVKPRAEYFPRRNRIISGMSLGTLVVEAGLESGALITARHALEQNREVFAVPGSILSPNSKGTNRLIQRSEAKLVAEAKDILEELNLSFVGRQIEMTAMFPPDDNESSILYHVGHEPTHIDEIIRDSGMTISTVSGLLAMMELKGMVRQVGGMNYVKV